MAENSSYILLLEDNPDDVFLFARAAAKAEIAFRRAEDGEFGKKVLLTSERPKLIVTDLRMPRCDGVEFISWLRAQSDLKDIPVIVFSTSALDEDRSRALSAGAADYLVKPKKAQEYAAILASFRSFLYPDQSCFG